MSSKDTDFLKQRVTAAAQPKEATTTTRTSVVDDTNTFLENITADEPTVTTPRQAALNRRAKVLGANDPDQVARQQAAEEQQQAEEEQQSTVDISGRVSRVVSTASNSVNPLIDKVGSVPTVGGIGLLVLILALLLFTVVRVNDQGDTRMKQFWYMLNGRATIKGRRSVLADTSTGSVASFGAPGGAPPGSVSSFGTTPDLSHSGGSSLGF